MLQQSAQPSSISFLGIVASIVGGGLSGGCVSLFFNRRWHIRSLRTKFYPLVNDMYSAYAIRLSEVPNGRYWVTTVGLVPAPADEKFVEHRSNFISDLVQFNELKEARKVRQAMVDNMGSGHHVQGLPSTLDLAPESQALNDCMAKLHKALKL